MNELLYVLLAACAVSSSTAFGSAENPNLVLIIADDCTYLDLAATIAALVGFNRPKDRVFDSIDLSPTLLNGSPSPSNEWSYYGQPGDLWDYRLGNHKFVFESWESLGTEQERGWRGYDNRQKHDPALLFDLTADISERRDVAAEQPRVVEAIREAITRHQQLLVLLNE